MRRTRIFTVAALTALGLLVAVLPTLLPPLHLDAQGLSTGFYSVPYTACSSQVSGNTSGTNGFTTAGASNTPVDQAQTSSSGTNTHTYICDITPPTRIQGGVGVRVVNVDFYYGVQTTGIGAQVNGLTSGLLNATTLFTKVTLPTPINSNETPSTVLPVRADTGTIVALPTIANFNTATTTAGAFYTQRFTPGTPFQMVDGTKYYLTVALLNTATSATLTNTIGVTVHTQ